MTPGTSHRTATKASLSLTDGLHMLLTHLEQKCFPCMKSSPEYGELDVEVLCRWLCSSQEIWVCRSPFAQGFWGRGAEQLKELEGPHPSWSRRNTVAFTCPAYLSQNNNKLDFHLQILQISSKSGKEIKLITKDRSKNKRHGVTSQVT